MQQIFYSTARLQFLSYSSANALVACDENVKSKIQTHQASIENIRAKSQQIKEQNLLSFEFARKFTNPSRYRNNLSEELLHIEQQNSVPWSLFFSWLNEIEGIDSFG